jgi:hypothetical protein
MTAEQAIRLKQLLGDPPENFAGIIYLRDQETAAYANQFIDIFLAKRWRVESPISPILSHVAGIFVTISPEDRTHPPREAVDLMYTLRAAGFDCRIAVTPWEENPGKFSLAIGEKP